MKHRPLKMVRVRRIKKEIAEELAKLAPEGPALNSLEEARGYIAWLERVEADERQRTRGVIAHLQAELKAVNARVAQLKDERRTTPDASFLIDLADKIEGWAARNEAPTAAFAKELAAELIDLAGSLGEES